MGGNNNNNHHSLSQLKENDDAVVVHNNNNNTTTNNTNTKIEGCHHSLARAVVRHYHHQIIINVSILIPKQSMPCKLK